MLSSIEYRYVSTNDANVSLPKSVDTQLRKNSKNHVSQREFENIVRGSVRGRVKQERNGGKRKWSPRGGSDEALSAKSTDIVSLAVYTGGNC